jgi:cytochrome c-550 PedF
MAHVAFNLHPRTQLKFIVVVTRVFNTVNKRHSSWPRMLLTLTGMALSCAVLGHGNVTPQPVDTHTLPQLGDAWLTENPYSSGPANAEAVRIGASGFNQNCARCHGLEAISGGIAPDLRKLDIECLGLASANDQNTCFKVNQAYFIATVRAGRTRDGRVFMPPFEGILSQEALWAIKSYLETRRISE